MILAILLLLFTFQLAKVDATATYVNNGCNKLDEGTFPKGSVHEKNLNSVFSSLTSQASSLKFYNTTFGDSPYKVYGIFQCREDLSSEVCNACVKDATQKIMEVCLLYVEGIVWYEECMLRYANRSIFSVDEVHPVGKRSSKNNISNFMELAPLFSETMNTLISDAPFNSGSTHFATRKANLTLDDKLYCLAQCTPDLSGPACNRCLKTALVVMINCCQGSKTAMIFFPSCDLRYDMSRFFNETNDSLLALPPSNTANVEKRLIKPILAATVIAASVGVGLVFVGIWFWLRRKKIEEKSLGTLIIERGYHKVLGNAEGKDSLGDDVEFVQYDFATLNDATGEFSFNNELGEGGFGLVYKGTLKNGQEVAIKRLSLNSGQGTKEFMTEAYLVAKLQHKNLVKLLGFCAEGEEKLLVYEFMPNKSLDYFLNDPSKRELLQWETRYMIITGIARGLQYLHKDSRITIVHRDMKTSNVLLDCKMNPKIADFGLAKVFGGKEKLGMTSLIAGTRGYMAPEYFSTGEYSEKSDVYSFGIITLEIVSGQNYKQFYKPSENETLPILAWRLWNQGRSNKLMDPMLYGNCSNIEVARCIHIGMLCVQENAEHRPTMAAILLMLSGSIDLPVPLGSTMPFDPNSQGFDTPLENGEDGARNKQGQDFLNQPTIKPTSSHAEVEKDLYPM